MIANHLLYVLLFSALAMGVFYLVPVRFRKLFLLVMSGAFYLLFDLKYFLIILFVTIYTFWAGKKVRKKVWPYAIPLLLVLILFKYNDFFIQRAHELFHLFGIMEVDAVVRLAMPLGLSYYLFKAISYIADISRNKVQPSGDYSSVALYISFFPQIISGPIDRYEHFCLQCKCEYDDKLFYQGFCNILKGLMMKLVIANRLASYCNTVFGAPEHYSSIALCLAAVLFSIYLYCDFAGYSNIAVGICNMLGYDSMINFRRPYFASGIKDFWDRWHISLSSWLRDYVYIPLGGNRRGKLRKWVNLFLTFLVSGTWHGNGVTFLAWGGIHALYHFVPYKERKRKWSRFLSIVATFAATTFAWIFFMSPSINSAGIYISRIFTTFQLNIVEIQNAILPFTDDSSCVAYFLTACIFILILFIREWIEEYRPSRLKSDTLWNIFLIVAIVFFGVFGNSSFLYAQF